MFDIFIAPLLASGLPGITISSLLYLPIATMFVTFSRYILGWKSYSMYVTVLFVFALLEFAVDPSGVLLPLNGLVIGLVFVVAATLSAWIMQSLLREITIQYLSKLALSMSLATFISLLLFYLLHFVIVFDTYSIHIMPIVVIVLTVDTFIRNYLRKGFRKAVILLGWTLALASAIYGVFVINGVSMYLLHHPEFAVYALVLSFFIGQWKGIRLSEYLRFKELLFDPEIKDDTPTVSTK